MHAPSVCSSLIQRPGRPQASRGPGARLARARGAKGRFRPRAGRRGRCEVSSHCSDQCVQLKTSELLLEFSTAYFQTTCGGYWELTLFYPYSFRWLITGVFPTPRLKVISTSGSAQFLVWEMKLTTRKLECAPGRPRRRNAEALTCFVTLRPVYVPELLHEPVGGLHRPGHGALKHRASSLPGREAGAGGFWYRNLR